MKNSRSSAELAFSLRFYEQVQSRIDEVVDAAVSAHPRIVGWSQTEDSSAERPSTVVTLSFPDKATLDAFRADERFVEVYLARAWGKHALTRGALRVKPSAGEERGTIPGDMFAHVGI